MANIIKHVGRHNNRKIAIVYNTIPDEEHMALIVYTDALPNMIHDEAMKVLESAVGQNEKNLADALFRNIMPDGRNCLEALHRGNLLQKVQTSQVIVMPTANSTIRLDELNTLLKEMEKGEVATKKLADIDANRGMKGVLEEPREVGQPRVATQQPVVNNNTDVLSDANLATQRLAQADKLRNDAKGLLAEAKRLEGEAKTLQPKKTNGRPSKKTIA